jgi:hypothetical protein
MWRAPPHFVFDPSEQPSKKGWLHLASNGNESLCLSSRVDLSSVESPRSFEARKDAVASNELQVVDFQRVMHAFTPPHPLQEK